MTVGHYILDPSGRVRRAQSLLEWAEWFERESGGLRRVGADDIGGFRVSTVFLGIDHGFADDGAPILWETMVFGDGDCGVEQKRCAGDRDQALAMHRDVCDQVRQATGGAR